MTAPAGLRTARRLGQLRFRLPLVSLRGPAPTCHGLQSLAPFLVSASCSLRSPAAITVRGPSLSMHIANAVDRNFIACFVTERWSEDIGVALDGQIV
ncbi:hypothetical protein NDU88_003986 [Pleurodeles waltl]|uniref:Uncharacterized protein n=1 Tax=Pleurodeles waltl TaxID=8319 RepID=A0AAV7KWF3_PLEWA|nr:hypothetical protein NDU88_003986 [Pleurodeles waltl]